MSLIEFNSISNIRWLYSRRASAGDCTVIYIFLFTVLAICCFGLLLSILYMFAKCEAKGEKYFKKRKEQRIIEKLKVLSKNQFSDSDDSDDEELSLKNPGKTLEKVYHVPASSKDNFKNFEYFEKLEK